MQVLKFGGTSLGSAELILNVLKIVKIRCQDRNIGLVLSAVSGVTNLLADSIAQVLAGDDVDVMTRRLITVHEKIITSLSLDIMALSTENLMNYLTEIGAKYSALLQGIKLIRECPDRVYCQILSFGERLSTSIFSELLVASGLDVKFIDSYDFIKTKGSLKEGTPVIAEIERRFATIREDPNNIILMPGFISSDLNGDLSLLGRNGSDYSASLMAVGLRAQHCEIWTDVDGIYTADPNQILEAKLIKEMSYGEAMELALYGAKVLHPKTTSALSGYNIPLYIKNTFNPEAYGTKISRTAEHDSYLICGISSIGNIALLHIHGSGVKGLPGIAARIFSTVSNCGVAIMLIISQASSENSICFCIAESDIAVVQQALQNELFLEIDARIIEEIEVIHNQSVICIVEDQMRFRYEIAGKFFSAIAKAGINILAIAQGSSERCISAVINGKDRIRAVQAVHSSFFHTLQPIELYIVGLGSVGGALVEQIEARQEELMSEGVDVKVIALVDSKNMVYSKNGINLADWNTSDRRMDSTQIDTSPKQEDKGARCPTNISILLDKIRLDKPINGVFVDCTSSERIALSYKEVFPVNLHVVTANKKGNSGTLQYYSEIRKKAEKYRRRFLYETTVGAGLPIIDTFQNLLKSGDKLLNFSGILSGSLSFIFGLLEDGIPFSQALTIACNKKFTEPDPRDDLNGMDVARKLLILAREAGYHYELSDIEIMPIFPEGFDLGGGIESFLARLVLVDDYFKDKVESCRRSNQVLRFVGEINDGKCTVGIKSIDNGHSLHAIKGGENAFAFLTKRYSPIPLVIRGYGAGVEVTAAGVFADILKTVDFNVTNNVLQASVGSDEEESNKKHCGERE